MNKKKILAAALAVCLLGTISYSTLAWFNASETVTNRFMVASSGSGLGDGGTPSTPADKVFSLDLWEYVDDNGNGVNEAHEKVAYRSDTALGWDYKDILPGVKYHKEPIVENTGSYDQYIRVVVTLTNATKWKYVMQRAYGTETVDLGTIFLGHDEDLWVRGEILEGLDVKVPIGGGSTKREDDTISYVYYLDRKLAPGETAAVFTDVMLPERLTQEDLAFLAVAKADFYELEFAIDVRADAVQTQGIQVAGDTVAEQAESAFAKIGWKADLSYDERVTP